jgi:eukaryotic-like serine/threonine-protein kinase
VGLFMFTKLRFQPHTSPKPPPEIAPSAPLEPLEPAASAAPDPLALPSGSADPAGAPSSAPDALSGVDASGLRVLLSRAARTREWRDGEAALLALAERDPASFSRGDVVTAVRDVVAGLEHDGQADKVFDVLSSRLGDDGLDVLYEIVQAKGGSRAAARAAELLRKDAVRARETPALRIAVELRDASCVDKLKLLDRAVQDGDARALMLLETQGLACFKKSREVEQAITDLRARLSKR